MRQKRPTHRTQHHTSSRALEQWRADLALQLGDAPTDGGLGAQWRSAALEKPPAW
jgi:hypothetical protein